MKRVLGILVLVWAVASLGLGQKLVTQQAEVVTGITVDQAFDFLLANEVEVSKVTSTSGTSYLLIRFGEDRKLFLDFYDCTGGICGSMLASAVFSTKNPPSLEAINRFNFEYRFARAYLGDSGEAWLESDWRLEGGVVLEGMLFWLDDFANTINGFARTIGFK